MKLTEKLIPIDNLLLDPNNYRFHDLSGWKKVHDNKFSDIKVQQNATKFLRDTNAFELSALKESIRTNGFVELERIVVRPYIHAPNNFIVVEGNRRVAAIKWLTEDLAGGYIEIPDERINKLKTVNVLVLDPAEPENAHAVEVIMAIRHVGGIKEWGAYQQARLVVELLEQTGATLSSVADKLGMNSREVARRFRASKALQQMENDEEYKDYVEPKMYSIFHEVVAQPAVRDWLGWDETNNQFNNIKHLHILYSLICTTEDQSAKITSYADIRSKFKTIIQSSRAIHIIQDPDRTLDDAHRIAIEELTVDNSSTDFELALQSAYKALDKLPISTVSSFTSDHKKLMLELQQIINQRLEQHKMLQPQLP